MCSLLSLTVQCFPRVLCFLNLCIPLLRLKSWFWPLPASTLCKTLIFVTNKLLNLLCLQCLYLGPMTFFPETSPDTLTVSLPSQDHKNYSKESEKNKEDNFLIKRKSKSYLFEVLRSSSQSVQGKHWVSLWKGFSVTIVSFQNKKTQVKSKWAFHYIRTLFFFNLLFQNFRKPWGWHKLKSIKNVGEQGNLHLTDALWSFTKEEFTIDRKALAVLNRNYKSKVAKLAFVVSQDGCPYLCVSYL